ncbi:MAG: hypothetical protein ACRDG4_01675, partial [Chloroflexota bacterium]
AGRRDLRALLESPRVAVHCLDEADLSAIDPDPRSFSGANTPEEWEIVRAEVERYAERVHGSDEQAGNSSPAHARGPRV